MARLKDNFVCTVQIIDDVQKWATRGDPLAQALADHWEYPVEMMFLKPDCTLVSRLNSFKDFPKMHQDVSEQAGEKETPVDESLSHQSVFLKHLAAHFDKK